MPRIEEGRRARGKARRHHVPEFPEAVDAVADGVAHDERPVDRADGNARDPVRRDVGFGHRLEDAGLVGAERAPALEDEDDVVVLALGASGPGHDAASYDLMPAALMIGHHFSFSALWCARSASGVCWSSGGISWPSSCSCLRTAGSASASRAAALSFMIASRGVPF